MRNKLLKKQAELLAWHRDHGCVNVRKLARKTRVAITMSDDHYELEVGTPERGVVIFASERIFWPRDKAIVLGSMDPETGIFLPEIIGYGLKMVLRKRRRGILRTAPVLGVKLRGPNDSYEYELWEE
ncbi:MAG: hypothetical protein AMS22_12695 [Thiotrichales bacterium SG8_50]|nr:MAG: hypothetical protein AMS22_12695 [Thiotrichales bacterium SG8_50]